MEREKIEYRHSDSKDFHKIVQWGLEKVGANIVCKRGVFPNDVDYYAWYEEVADDRVNKRRDVTIRLLNEKHQPVAAWKASRCIPLKITGPDLKSDANEIAVEAIEIAHEGLTHIDI
jgi:phage tail-like protein